MYIKSIRLQGFKSFADKTEIVLDKDICAVVGPNGSGKSNVVDALLWVLGEQSVKLLRGDDKMSDVIFSGSKTREALNKASVAILFDNNDHVLSSEYNEIEVKRVIYRSGENEYFINGVKVRLKDITDLIIDVSSKFNIVTQGNINALIDNKSSERRVLFESAARVLKYKKRKEDTLKKLDSTKENMTRLDLIIKEVLSSLEPLEKQKKDAEKYLDIKKNLENIEIALLASDITNYKNEYDKLKIENDVLQKKQEFLVIKNPEELEKLKLELIKIDEKITDNNKKLIDINDKLSKLNSQKQISIERSKLSIDTAKLNDNLLSLEEEKNEIQKNIKIISKDIDYLKNEFNKDIKEFNEKSDKNLKDKIVLSNLKNDYNLLSKEMFVLENKISILKNNISNNNFLPKAVKEVLANKNLSGIHNTIGKIISYNEAHKEAILTSLGQASNFIVVDNLTCAKSAINYLKNGKLGRATFFPIDIIKSRYIGSNINKLLDNYEGFIGIASDLISYDNKYKNIIENQLGNVIIVDGLDDMEIVAKKVDFKYKIVSLEGDVLYPGGAILGGEKSSFSDDKTSLAKLENEYNNKKGLLESVNISIDNTEKRYNSLESEITQMSNDIARKRLVIEEKESLKNNYNKKLDEIISNIAGLNNINNQNLDEDIKSLINMISEVASEKEIIQNELNILHSQKFDINEKIENKEKEISEINSNYNKNESLIKNNQIEIGKKEVLMESLLNNLQTEYNITYEYALNNYSLDIDEGQARGLVNKYKGELKRLTNINLGSISEYDRLKKRYDFLAKQKDDLQSSSNELLSIISEMDEIMKKRFKDTFEAISKEFSTVFRKMFKGGNGLLKLTDENDLLNTGISILAVPPGKKLNSTAALSGGEKALTAICLIFAILNVKPAPFIVLDEVEAALDEENVAMFGDYLSSMKNTSQFILITHKKKMMEYAKLLYGVTMQESGVSKLVSVELKN